MYEGLRLGPVHSARLEIEGTLDWVAGLFDTSGGGGNLIVQAGATLTCTASANVDCYVPVDNQGTIVMNQTSTVRYFVSAASTNDGLFEIAGGTTRFWTGDPTQGPPASPASAAACSRTSRAAR